MLKCKQCGCNCDPSDLQNGICDDCREQNGIRIELQEQARKCMTAEFEQIRLEEINK